MQNSRKLYPVKVVERGSELFHLLLADSFGIPGEDLGLNLVDGAGDSREEQLPPDTDMLLMWWQSRCVNTDTPWAVRIGFKTGYLNVGLLMLNVSVSVYIIIDIVFLSYCINSLYESILHFCISTNVFTQRNLKALWYNCYSQMLIYLLRK